MGQKGVKFSQSHKKKDGPLTLDDPVTHNDYERAAAAILDADVRISLSSLFVNFRLTRSLARRACVCFSLLSNSVPNCWRWCWCD